jgi:hypothetical protein
MGSGVSVVIPWQQPQSVGCTDSHELLIFHHPC